MRMEPGEVMAVALQPPIGETTLHVMEKVDGEIAYIEAVGEIDLEGERMMRRAMESTLAQGARSVIFDLRRVYYMDTGALKILLEAKARAAGWGGEVYVLVEEALPRRVIYMAHLQHALRVCENADEALEEIARRATRRGPAESATGRREETDRPQAPVATSGV